MTTLTEARDMVSPGVWAFSPNWVCLVDNDEIVVGAFGKRYVLVTRSEVDSNDYKRFIAPRLAKIEEENRK